MIVILYVLNEYFWTVATYITYYLSSNVSKGVVNFFHFYINFDFEFNIPTILSTLLLISCSFLVFWLIRLRFSRKFNIYLIALIFIALAFEELLGIHEIIHSYLSDFLFFGWILPGLVISFILGFFFFKFILNIPLRFRKKIKIAGLIYVIGALGFEFLTFVYSYYFGDDLFIKKMIGATEELLEFFGIILFLRVFLEMIKFQQQLLKNRISEMVRSEKHK